MEFRYQSLTVISDRSWRTSPSARFLSQRIWPLYSVFKEHRGLFACKNTYGNICFCRITSLSNREAWKRHHASTKRERVSLDFKWQNLCNQPCFHSSTQNLINKHALVSVFVFHQTQGAFCHISPIVPDNLIDCFWIAVSSFDNERKGNKRIILLHSSNSSINFFIMASPPVLFR